MDFIAWKFTFYSEVIVMIFLFVNRETFSRGLHTVRAISSKRAKFFELNSSLSLFFVSNLYYVWSCSSNFIELNTQSCLILLKVWAYKQSTSLLGGWCLESVFDCSILFSKNLQVYFCLSSCRVGLYLLVNGNGIL